MLKKSVPTKRDQKSAEKQLKQSKSQSAVKVQLNQETITGVEHRRSPTTMKRQKTQPTLIQSNHVTKLRSRFLDSNENKENHIYMDGVAESYQ